MLHVVMLALALVIFALLAGFVEATDRLTAPETAEPREDRP
jgi:hypothetical protein